VSDVTVEIQTSQIEVNFGTFDQVSGASGLTTANRVVKVSATGIITEDGSLAVNDGVVTGAKSIAANDSTGLVIKNSAGAMVATFGPGPSLAVVFAMTPTDGTAIAGGLRGVSRFEQAAAYRASPSYPESLFRI
jgi:hypothetical protein